MIKVKVNQSINQSMKTLIKVDKPQRDVIISVSYGSHAALSQQLLIFIVLVLFVWIFVIVRDNNTAHHGQTAATHRVIWRQAA